MRWSTTKRPTVFAFSKSYSNIFPHTHGFMGCVWHKINKIMSLCWMYEIITSSGCQSNRSVNLSIGSCFASILRITIVHQSISALAIINLRLGKHFSVCVCVSLCQFIIYSLSLSLCNFLMMTRLFLSLNYEQEKVNLFLCLVFLPL